MNTTKITLLITNILVITLVIAHYLQRIQADPQGDFPFFVGSIHFGILVVFLASEGIALIIRKTLTDRNGQKNHPTRKRKA